MKSRPLLVIVGLALAALTVALWRIPRPRPDLESQIEHAQARLASANLLLDQLQADLARQRRQQSESDSMLNSLIARMTESERQLNDLKNARGSPRSTALPAQAPADPADPGLPKRAWGPEQAAGPPDTFASGDISTAWASLEPDAGIEWLKLDYEKAVNLAEIHVRETFNPGAISKVTAVLPDGQEFSVWEGTEPAGTAPINKVFKATGNLWTKSIVIYLDTSRVPGWNEIDAVEIVGHDGSRQWASQAAASSSYADRRGNELPQQLGR